MNATEKARSLIGRYYAYPQNSYPTSKECALICVEEILLIPGRRQHKRLTESGGFGSYYVQGLSKHEREFWQEVKTEIQKL